jgi:hypothetical protein
LDDLKARSSARRNLMKFRCNVDYVVSDADREDLKTPDGRLVASAFKENRGVTDFLVRNAIAARYKDGVKDRTVQRTLARVQNAFIRAVRDGEDEVELDEEQLRFVHDTLKEWSVPPGLVAWHVDLLESIEAAVSAIGEEKRAAKIAGK